MKKLQEYINSKFIKTAFLNYSILGFQSIYLLLRFSYVNEIIPIWYSKPWGDFQLDFKRNLFIIPLMTFAIVTTGLFFGAIFKKKYYRYGEDLSYVFITICNLLMTFSVVRIIQIASVPFEPLIYPLYLTIVPPAFLAFAIVYLITPKIIELLKENGIITDPQLHKHPGMLLVKPSARGGGAIFAIGVAVTSLFFVKISPVFIGLTISMALAAILGIIDDIQNTRPIAKFKKIEDPKIRFILQAIVALPVLFSGIQILNISNPFNGMLDLTFWGINVGGGIFYPVAFALTLVWFLWIMNLLSWSNGVDGQYSGIIGIAAIVIAVITMRETPLTLDQKNLVNIAAIIAGSALGLLPYTWHPSKIMWGFGAITAGTALATLSVLTKAKIATALLVLAVPFLDGMITVIRRIIQRKSPLKGDKGHLHHLLLARGWSIKQVAVFYWVSTLATGYIGILAADKDPMLAALTLAGLIAFFIAILNIKQKKTK